MKGICFVCVLVTSQLYSQDIDLQLDTVFADPSFYYKRYKFQKTGEITGEGFELLKRSKLKHAFFGDYPASSYYDCGSWTIVNDSIVLLISDKRLVTKYAYKRRQSYRPLIISWELRTDLRNNDNKLLVLENKLVVLNNAVEPNELLNQLRAMIVPKISDLNRKDDAHDAFYFFQLNEKIVNEFYNFLYEKKLFASLEALKKYE